jgi:hypothetical protein
VEFKLKDAMVEIKRLKSIEEEVNALKTGIR